MVDYAATEATARAFDDGDDDDLDVMFEPFSPPTGTANPGITCARAARLDGQPGRPVDAHPHGA